MLRYIIRRLLQVIPTLLGISFISYSLLYIFPRDPLAEIILTITTGFEPSVGAIEKFRAEMCLDRPLIVQYFDWLSKAIRGDFGISWTKGEPVMNVILERLPISAELFFATFAISVVFALILGVISAVHKDKAVDHIYRIYSLLGISIPSFWLELILIWIFSFNYTCCQLLAVVSSST